MKLTKSITNRMRDWLGKQDDFSVVDGSLCVKFDSIKFGMFHDSVRVAFVHRGDEVFVGLLDKHKFNFRNGEDLVITGLSGLHKVNLMDD